MEWKYTCTYIYKSRIGKRRKEILLSMHLGRSGEDRVDRMGEQGWRRCEVQRMQEGNNMEGDIFRAARRDGKQRGSEDNEVQGKQRLAG